MFLSKVKAMICAGAVALVPASVFLIAPAAANAFSLEQQTSVPFAFRIGNRTLPAGTYKLRQVFETTNLSYYLVNTETGRAAMVSRSFGAGEKPIELIFSKDEEGYVLKKVR
jgi:hypothetical protein